MTRTVLRLTAVVLLTSWTLITPAALANQAPHPRASLTDIENDVMCTLCHESLAVAQSPQADSERNYIRGLIAKGETKQQILNNMVAQYGPEVLGRPPASGFNLSVYVLPPAILLIGTAILAFTLPDGDDGRARQRTDPPATAQPPRSIRPRRPGSSRSSASSAADRPDAQTAPGPPDSARTPQTAPDVQRATSSRARSRPATPAPARPSAGSPPTGRSAPTRASPGSRRSPGSARRTP
jgi:cytochrome c-type biogenesis protein CcmH/NrfF